MGPKTAKAVEKAPIKEEISVSYLELRYKEAIITFPLNINCRLDVLMDYVKRFAIKQIAEMVAKNSIADELTMSKLKEYQAFLASTPIVDLCFLDGQGSAISIGDDLSKFAVGTFASGGNYKVGVVRPDKSQVILHEV